MIGQLPRELVINGVKRAIRSDFRVALLIFQAYNDAELSDQEKATVTCECLYEDIESFTQDEANEAIEKAIWFLDGGKSDEDIKQKRKVMDWEQDEQLIFPAINKVAGCETREKEYIHWWTFLGFFNEIGEGLFTNVISIRLKKSKGKKLEKHEQEFYRENQKLVDIKTKYNDEEQKEIDRLNAIFN